MYLAPHSYYSVHMGILSVLQPDFVSSSECDESAPWSIGGFEDRRAFRVRGLCDRICLEPSEAMTGTDCWLQFEKGESTLHRRNFKLFKPQQVDFQGKRKRHIKMTYMYMYVRDAFLPFPHYFYKNSSEVDNRVYSPMNAGEKILNMYGTRQSRSLSVILIRRVPQGDKGRLLSYMFPTYI